MERIEAIALERFVHSVSPPLVLEIGEALARCHGTGTLFEIEGRYFIITARHIFDGIDASALAIPEHPTEGGMHTLGCINIYRPDQPHVDVAAIELLQTEIISKLQRSWQWLSLANVALPTNSVSASNFFVSGYPTAESKEREGSLAGKLCTAYTQRLIKTPAEAGLPVTEGLDFFLEYKREAYDLSGQLMTTPVPPGMSGASIWERRSVSGVWTPESSARVVGIQTSFVHSEFLRAKSWMAVAILLSKVDSHLEKLVKLHLGV
jgi:hypothetical protein